MGLGISIYTLIICPAAYLLYEKTLGGLERLWVWKWTADPSVAKKFAEVFAIELDMNEFYARDDIRAAFLLVERNKYKRMMEELSQWWTRLKGKFTRVIFFWREQRTRT